MLTLSVYRTLSVRYLLRRWTRAVLIVLSIALGVATVVATRSLNQTMTRAAAHPLSGTADLIVSNGDSPVEKSLAQDARVPGVRRALPLLLGRVQVPALEDARSVWLLGIDEQAIRDMNEMKGEGYDPWGIEESKGAFEAYKMFAVTQNVAQLFPMVPQKVAKFFVQPVVVGHELDKGLPPGHTVSVRATRQKETTDLRRVGTVTPRGDKAKMLAHMLLMDLESAARLMGQPAGMATRLDLILEPGADREQVRRAVARRLEGRAQVQTPEEEEQTRGSVMHGMQTGFTLCGLAALVVGMFLVFNALSVSVAERRHEIGILRSLGGTCGQVRGLFAGEALLLGLGGAAVGVPLGLLLAYLGLGPVQRVLGDIFFKLEANTVDITWGTVLLAVGAGMVTALAAVLLPALRAAREDPASAVR